MKETVKVYQPVDLDKLVQEISLAVNELNIVCNNLEENVFKVFNPPVVEEKQVQFKEPLIEIWEIQPPDIPYQIPDQS